MFAQAKQAGWGAIEGGGSLIKERCAGMGAMEMKGKVAWITGGGTGIGAGIAEAFAEAGTTVAIASRNPEHLKKAERRFLERGFSLAAFVANVTRPDEVDTVCGEIVKRFGKIDILVNNAGVSGPAPLAEMEDEHWRKIIETNLTGPFYCSRAALRRMQDHAQGRIINISSVLGKFGVAGYTAYCATKHGIIGFTRALALEVADRGITVNAICPGWVDTAMAQEGIEAAARAMKITPEAFRKMAVDAVPSKRFTEPREVGALAVYLASEAASNMTGQAINLCGGATTA
jgi:3-hydroxybutyrate dehydrogenase